MPSFPSCPAGRGYVKTARTVCYEVFREIRRAFTGAEEKKALITVNSVVADMMYDEERQGVEEREFWSNVTEKDYPLYTWAVLIRRSDGKQGWLRLKNSPNRKFWPEKIKGMDSCS